jgi:hypothetical protein
MSQHHATFTWGAGPQTVSLPRQQMGRADPASFLHYPSVAPLYLPILLHSQVHISGGFNSWSDKASPLQKQADGTFKGEVALPWGEKQAFKYVVDGGGYSARSKGRR